MSELIPYLGVAFVILVFTATAAFLAKRGLKISKVKHDKTEVEFDTSKHGERETRSFRVRIPSRDEIELTQEILHDCDVLGVAHSDVEDFILRETEHHPILFLSDFFSLPLVFYQHVLLLSWDLKCAKAERLLDREEAYPTNDLWSSCLAVYRQATMLPYRHQSDPQRLVASSEAKRSLAVYRRLVTTANAFLDGIESQTNHRPAAYVSLISLVDDAEFALASDDIGTATARMEALLSTVHKLVLHHAPQGIGQVPQREEEAPTLLERSEDVKTRILVIDDDRRYLDELNHHLMQLGYNVLATTDARAAMRALVEYTFDVVITDMRMSFARGGLDGREITLAAKKANPNAKVIILTAYFETTLVSDASSDLALDKGNHEVWEKLGHYIEMLCRE